MNKHVQKIQKELEEAKARLDKQQNKKVVKAAMVVIGLFVVILIKSVTFMLHSFFRNNY